MFLCPSVPWHRRTRECATRVLLHVSGTALIRPECTRPIAPVDLLCCISTRSQALGFPRWPVSAAQGSAHTLTSSCPPHSSPSHPQAFTGHKRKEKSPSVEAGEGSTSGPWTTAWRGRRHAQGCFRTVLAKRALGRPGSRDNAERRAGGGRQGFGRALLSKGAEKEDTSKVSPKTEHPRVTVTPQQRMTGAGALSGEGAGGP